MNLKDFSRKALSTLVLSMLSLIAFAQNQTVSGVVSDDFGEPMLGVNVVVKGTTNGAVTDFDGNFTIQNVKSTDVLVFSFIGYLSQEVTVGSQSKINVTLREDNQNLEEVVVVGYGVVKKRDLTGSVASVKTEDIGKVAASNALQAMQAKVPGVDIQQGSGQAGSSPSISIRGNRSIQASNSPLIIVDGVEYGSTLDIPANDIESMDILKDASSTAIYGTKGANGVIIITTKRGSAGKSRVSFNSYLSFNSPTAIVKAMQGEKEVQRWIDRANYAADLKSGNWGSANTSVSDIFGSQQLDDGTLITDVISSGSYTDWYDEIFQTSTTQNYEFSVQGGNEKTKINLSLAYMSDRGLLKFDKMNRYNGRINIDHVINKVFSVGGNVGFTYKSHDSRNSGVFSSARKMTSITHVYNADGSINETPNIWYTAHVNPLMDEDGNYTKNVETTRFLGSAFAQAQIIKGLVFRSQISIDRSNSRTGVYQDYQSTGRYQSPSTTAISNGTAVSTKYTWQNTLNYALTLADKHDLGFLLGHEMYQSVKEGLDLSGTAGKEHYYNSTFYDVTKITDDIKYSSSYTKQAMLSFFGRVNYSYLGRYLVQASVRADGSSVLAEGNKWGVFPSVSAGWRINDEAFMEGTKDWLDNLKFRASWGLSGNAAISPYQTLATVTATVPASATMFIPTTMSNPDLSWEKTSAFDFGLDFSVWNGRFSGSVDYYATNTYDLLYPKSAPASSIFTTVLSNIGKTKGHGVEVSLNAIAVRTKDFTWDFNASFTTSKDEVVELADGLDRNISGTSGFIVGEPISLYYDYEVANCWGVGEYDKYVSDMKAKGVDVVAPTGNYGTPGTMRIIDQNGDGKINEDDKIVYRRNPTAIIGLSTNLSYKNWSLGIQTMARLGGYFSYGKNTNLGLEDGDANWTDIDYWTPSNTNTKFPNPGANTTDLKGIYSAYKSALGYEKSDYFKIKDITLAYSLDKNLVNKAHIANARIYCSLKNFITFNRLGDDYDPERGGGIDFPLAKQVVVGLNVTF